MLVDGLRVSVELVMCLDMLVVWRRQRSCLSSEWRHFDEFAAEDSREEWERWDEESYERVGRMARVLPITCCL